VTKAAIATDVHQPLDVHRRFAAKVALDREQSDAITDFLQIPVREILDLFGISDVTCFAYFASACTTYTKYCSQTDLSVLLRRNINTSDTSHFGPLKLLESALTLLMTRVCANYADNTLATDDFTVAANFLDRS
jgi:hypothetical protein